MKIFSDCWWQLEWDDICLCINSKIVVDVEWVLVVKQFICDDMMVLFLFVVVNYFELLVQCVQCFIWQCFGNIVSFYVLLYFFNLCVNDCIYCGFLMSNCIKCKMLDVVEIVCECVVICNLGFEYLLLVIGEYQGKVGMDYFCQYLLVICSQFVLLYMEVQLLVIEEYVELKILGFDGVMVYQEIYYESMYVKYYLKGKKQDFFWWLDMLDCLGVVGIDKIGFGVFIGFFDSW